MNKCSVVYGSVPDSDLRQNQLLSFKVNICLIVSLWLDVNIRRSVKRLLKPLAVAWQQMFLLQRLCPWYKGYIRRCVYRTQKHISKGHWNNVCWRLSAVPFLSRIVNQFVRVFVVFRYCLFGLYICMDWRGRGSWILVDSIQVSTVSLCHEKKKKKCLH